MGMVDVSDKAVVHRTALAEGRLTLRPETAEAIRRGETKKGDPLRTAEVAALLGVKETPHRIPHCHPIPITTAGVEFRWEGDDLVCRCRVEADYKTGVEMEALVGVSSALLTVWDMVKYLEKDEDGQYPVTVLSGITVLEKTKEG